MEERKKSGKSRAEQVRAKKSLLAVWAVFLVILIIAIVLFIRNKDALLDDLGVKKKETIYTENQDQAIDKLVRDYYTAYAACDQKALQSMVVDPSLFNDMSIVEKKANVVTAYNNLKVYTVPGLTADATVVYILTNISIANVVSTPLDMIQPPLYLLKKDGSYVIDNSTLSSDILNYIDSLNQKEDIQELMKLVREDQEKCLREDETFRQFYERLNNAAPQTGSTSGE